MKRKAVAKKAVHRRTAGQVSHRRHIAPPASASEIRKALGIRQKDVEIAHKLLSDLSLSE